jgi:uncharacterized protein YkwD
MTMTTAIRLRALTSAAALAISAACIVTASAQDLNAFRAANGRPALRVNSSLTVLAHAHANDMARRGQLDHNGFFQHRGPNGARAENVAYGCGDMACTIRQWSRSSGHRTNMLRRDVHGYGIASAVSSNGRRYWALELGH